ncbi:protein kintoun-like isoform X2 [Stylophora pistillata]|nr:protein kintoun-like isoform X2 [Stylophora pistillata]
MEKMRGMDVKFVNPEGGYVVKTRDLGSNVKAFVNICMNQHIGQASSQYTEREENGKKRAGHQWNIPYSLSQPREDVDRAGKHCTVYDAVFHPDTYKKGQEDKRFKQLMIDTAIDGILREFKAKLDKKNLKFPKMTFKGVKQSTIIRTKTNEVPKDSAELMFGGEKFPYPYSDEPKVVTKEKKPTVKDGQRHKKKTDDPSVPEFRIVHRGLIDLQNFTNARDSNPTTRPKELVVYIDLPLLESAAHLELDILEKQLVLVCEKPHYNLDIALPYPIDEEKGSAKFDKSKRQLTVTLPVLPATDISQMDMGIVADQVEDEVQPNSLQLSNQDVEPFSGELQQPKGDSVEQSLKVNNRKLSDESNEENKVLHICGVEDETDIRFQLPSSSSELCSPCFFTTPPYRYHQHDDVITFIIDVQNIALDSVSLGFKKNKAYISFPSGKSHPGELPAPEYALYLQFPDDHNLDSDLCNIDVNEENLVLNLYKQESCKGMWDSFEAGSGEESLKTQFFVSEKMVDKMMEEVAEQDPWSTAAPNGEAHAKVSSLTDDCLTIRTDRTDQGKSLGNGEFLESHIDAKNEKLDKRRMGDNISSYEEVKVTKVVKDLERIQLEESQHITKSNGERNGNTVMSDSEDPDSKEAIAEKGDSFVPIDVISNAVRSRRSILRRTSSTSTDDSQGDENESNGVPDSPSKKNVRFNLNPNVRVFSNKKDKKKRKLEARLKAEARKHSFESESSGSEYSNGTSPVDSGTGWDAFDDQSRRTGTYSENGDTVSKVNDVHCEDDSVSKQAGVEAFGMANHLIFELDD